MAELAYRHQALRRYHSPEHLDQLLEVTGSKAWLALGALGLALSSGLIWGVFGTLPIKVAGNGIIQLHTGGTRAVVAQGSGLLTEINVSPGKIVKTGDIIGRLTMYDLAQQMDAANLLVTNLVNERRQLVVFYNAYLAKQSAISKAGAIRYKKMTRDGYDQIAAYRKLYDGMKRLQASGFASAVQVEAANEKLTTAVHDRDQAAVDSLQIESSFQSIINERDQALRANNDKLLEARSQIKRLAGLDDIGRNIRAPIAGRVLQVESQLHTMVDVGTTIALIEVQHGRPSAIMYVPAADGKLIAPQMQVEVSPTTVKPEQYGSIIGKVRLVGSYPATPADMMRLLNNQDLVKNFAATGPQLEVVIDLQQSRQSESQFKWTSAKGPPLKVSSGTIAAARITVESAPPITFVMPFFKRLFGV